MRQSVILKCLCGASAARCGSGQPLPVRYICENGFEHPVAANLSPSAAAVHEATTKYLGWDVCWHR